MNVKNFHLITKEKSLCQLYSFICILSEITGLMEDPSSKVWHPSAACTKLLTLRMSVSLWTVFLSLLHHHREVDVSPVTERRRFGVAALTYLVNALRFLRYVPLEGAKTGPLVGTWKEEDVLPMKLVNISRTSFM